MTRTVDLHKNPQHNKAENTDFMLRLRFKKEGDNPLKTDWINLSMQYVWLYQAMEARLDELSQKGLSQPYLDCFKEEVWAKRSACLENDIAGMRFYLSSAQRQYQIRENTLFPAMEKMIEVISQADALTLFAFFSVRCLGDAFGGQALKEYTKRSFNNQFIALDFYNGLGKQAQPLSRIVNHVEFTEEEESQYAGQANYCFEQHVKLFEEMETWRSKREQYIHDKNLKNQEKYDSVVNCCSSFFVSAAKVVVVGAVAATGALSIALNDVPVLMNHK